MKRKVLPFVAIAAVMLAVAALLLWMQPRDPSPAPSGNVTEAEAVDPLVQEMACVDRVLQNRNLKSEAVQPALDRCRGRAGSAEANLTQ
ncbi:MAG TPA: hypothetical protein VEW04_02890 [Allosphingosinicella sp.]|nr:hypothetical protein [Allosphingosinicella sp.]